MKTKHFEKKLNLNRKTIANLDQRTMNHVVAGYETGEYRTCEGPCDTLAYTCGPDTTCIYNCTVQETDTCPPVTPNTCNTCQATCPRECTWTCDVC